jgi:hypothetical protein
MMAAVTLLFAIPANDFRWQMEIYNRGGAAWTVDKDGHFGWRWMVEPKADFPHQKPARVPSYQVERVNARTEQL